MSRDHYRVMKERYANDMDALEHRWAHATTGTEIAGAFMDAVDLIARDEFDRAEDADPSRREQLMALFRALEPYLARMIDSARSRAKRVRP